MGKNHSKMKAKTKVVITLMKVVWIRSDLGKSIDQFPSEVLKDETTWEPFIVLVFSD